MKTNILRLIQDDIKISRLIGVLEQLDISANSYYLGNSAVIFFLYGNFRQRTQPGLVSPVSGAGRGFGEILRAGKGEGTGRENLYAVAGFGVTS